MSPQNPVLLVGAGIAGVSAALWMHHFGVPFLWIDRNGHIGGTLFEARNPLHNFPGLFANPGTDATRTLHDHCNALGLAPQRDTLKHIDLETGTYTRTATTLRDRYAILTSGLTPRPFSIPGLELLSAHIVHTSTRRLASDVQGRKVALIGGGDGALEGALILAHAGAHVHIFHRAERSHARPAFLHAADAHPAITRHPATHVTSIAPSPPHQARITTRRGSLETSVEIDHIVPKIGFQPTLCPSSPLPLPTHHNGVVHVHPDQSILGTPWLFAAGDLAQTSPRTLAEACASGTRAAHSIAAAYKKITLRH